MLVQISLNSQVSTASAIVAIAVAKPKTLQGFGRKLASVKVDIATFRKQAKAKGELERVRGKIETITHGHHSPKQKKEAIAPLKVARDKLREQLKELKSQRHYPTASITKLFNMKVSVEDALAALRAAKGKKPALPKVKQHNDPTVTDGPSKASSRTRVKPNSAPARARVKPNR